VKRHACHRSSPVSVVRSGTGHAPAGAWMASHHAAARRVNRFIRSGGSPVPQRAAPGAPRTGAGGSRPAR
jgi:hypothetical protein